MAGDRIGNLYFGVHVMLAALITTSGALRLFLRLQTRAKAFHSIPQSAALCLR